MSGFSKSEVRNIERLVKQVQQDNAEAFSELYDLLFKPIYRYVYYRVERDEVEDITEMVFLRVWEKRLQYKKKPKVNFNSWVFRIAHNAVVDYYRNKPKNQTLELSDDIAEVSIESRVEGELQAKFERQELALAIRKLPNIQQQVVVLKFVNDLSNAEIASVLDKSEGAIRVIQFRALNRLKKILVENKKKKCNKPVEISFKTVQNA